MAHRVDADGYTTVGGERRFIDRSLPTEEGTEDRALWNNMVQEEIAHVVEYAGLTLEASGVADEAAGWTQLREAIFESGAVGDDALNNDIGLDKISHGTLTYFDAGTDSRITVNSTAASFGNAFTGPVGVYERRGINFTGSTSPGGIEPYLRWGVYDLSSRLLAGAASSVYTGTTAAPTGHNHLLGQKVVLSTPLDTGISDSAKIFGHVAGGEAYADSASDLSGGVKVHYISSGGTWHVDFIEQLFSATTTNGRISVDKFYLTVFYEGTYLTP